MSKSRVARRRRVARETVAEDPIEEIVEEKDEAVEEEVAEEVEEVAEEEIKRPIRRRTRAVPLEVAEPQSNEDFWRGMMDAIQAGDGVTITRLPDGDFVATKGIALKARELRKAAKGKREFTPEYVEWRKEWDGYTLEDKRKFCEDNDITWERHDSYRVDNIRLTVAVREALGIEKYKTASSEAS